MRSLRILAKFLLIAIPSALIALLVIWFLAGLDIPMDICKWNMDQRASLMLVFGMSWFFIFAGIEIDKNDKKANKEEQTCKNN